MAILFNSPGVLPPTEEKTYPVLWLSSFNVMAHDPNRPVSIHARIDKARVSAVDNDGNPTSYELMPGGTQDVHLENFYNTATPTQLAVAGSLLQMIKEIVDPTPPA